MRLMYVLCVERGSSSNHEGGTEGSQILLCVFICSEPKVLSFSREKLAKSREKQHGHIIYSMTYMKFAKYREACRQNARQKVELPTAKMVGKGGASSGYCFYLQDKFSHQKTWTQ